MAKAKTTKRESGVATVVMRSAKAVRRSQLELHYSKDNSKTFWMMVNSLEEPHRTTLYALGVALQSLESQVLKNMHDVVPGFVKEAYWFNSKK